MTTDQAWYVLGLLGAAAGLVIGAFWPAIYNYAFKRAGVPEEAVHMASGDRSIKTTGQTGHNFTGDISGSVNVYGLPARAISAEQLDQTQL